MKENPDRKKRISALQQPRTDFRSMMRKEYFMFCHLYVFIEIYSLIMAK